VALLVEKQMVIFSTDLLMYVFFGVFLIVLSLALYDRLKSGAPAIMQVATVIGIIWAGSLIASGMVLNAGIAPAIALYAKDPAQAALTWQGMNPWQAGWATAMAKSWAAFGRCWSAWPRYGLAGFQRLEYPRLVGWRGGYHLPYPRVDRPDDRSFWLEPNHLVRLVGDRSIAQQPKPGSVIPTAFSTKFQQQTRVLERLTLNLSNFEK